MNTKIAMTGIICAHNPTIFLRRNMPLSELIFTQKIFRPFHVASLFVIISFIKSCKSYLRPLKLSDISEDRIQYIGVTI